MPAVIARRALSGAPAGTGRTAVYSAVILGLEKQPRVRPAGGVARRKQHQQPTAR
jgi:hypothetical protein